MRKDKKFYSTSEVAKMLRVHPTTIMRLVKSERMVGYQIGGQLRIREDDLDDYMEVARVRVNKD